MSETPEIINSTELDRTIIPDGIDGVVEFDLNKNGSEEMIPAGVWAERKAAQLAARQAVGEVFEPQTTPERPVTILDMARQRALNVQSVRANAAATGYVAPEILRRTA